MRSADGFRPLSSVFDEWAAICIGVAAVVYVLCTLPPLLAPSGLLGSLGCFLVGLVLGLAASAALLVLLFMLVTEADRQKHNSKQLQAGAEAVPKWNSHRQLRGGFKAVPADCPLPSLRRRGHFRDWIWTVPASHWDPTQAMDEWPPASEGPQAIASKWTAKLKPGMLVLKPDDGHHKGSTSMVRLPLQECEIRVVTEGLRSKTRWWKKVPLVLKHPSRALLHGENSVYIFAANGYAKEQLYLALQHSIQEGAPFLGVSQMYAAFCHCTKATEVVPFPRAQDILADMEAAMQASADAPPSLGSGRRRGWFRFGRGKSSQRSLATTSTSSLHASHSNLSLPGRLAMQDMGMGLERGEGLRAARRSSSLLLTPVLSGMESTMDEELIVNGSLPAMDPDELEKRWEGQYRYRDRPDSMSSKKTYNTQVSLRASTTTTELDEARSFLNEKAVEVVEEAAKATLRHSAGTIDSAILEARLQEGAEDGFNSEESDNLPTATSGNRSPTTSSKAPLRPPAVAPLLHMHTSASMPNLTDIHLNTAPAGPSSPFRTACSEAGGFMAQPRSENGARSPAPTERANTSQLRLDDKGPPSPSANTMEAPINPVPSSSSTPPAPDSTTEHASQKVAVEGVHGLNMLLTRLWFELLRSRKFEEAARNLVQRKLDDIRRPPYLHRLLVTGVDLGTSGPFVKHIAALPCPNNSVVWPQVLLDVSYTGSLTLTIATKVELSKSKTWRGLERTIQSIRGREGQLLGGAREALRSQSSMDQDVVEMTEALAAIPTEGLQESRARGNDGREEAQGEQAKGSRRRWMGMLPGIRRAVADGIRNAVDAVSDSLAKIPFQIHVKLTRIEGTLLLWVPPPPSDRLWISFINTPKLDLTCKPSLGNRVLQSTTFLTRASSWLHSKLLRALTKSSVFPACNDIKLPWFADLEAQEELKPLHLFNQQQQQEWETASSGESEAAEDEAGLWLADDVPVVSHPVCDLTDPERAASLMNPHQLPASNVEPPEVEISASSLRMPLYSSSQTSGRFLAPALTEGEARKLKKKETKGAKEAKKREAKEQRAEAKQQRKRDKLLARELSHSTASTASHASTTNLLALSQQGSSKSSMLKRAWFTRRGSAMGSRGLPPPEACSVGPGQYEADIETEPRAMSMGPSMSGELRESPEFAELRRSNSMSDLAELKHRARSSGLARTSRSLGSGTLDVLDTLDLGSETLPTCSSSLHSTRRLTQVSITTTAHSTLSTTSDSQASFAQEDKHMPKHTSDSRTRSPDPSVPDPLPSESPELPRRTTTFLKLPMPPEAPQSPITDPLGGIPISKTPPANIKTTRANTKTIPAQMETPFANVQTSTTQPVPVNSPTHIMQHLLDPEPTSPFVHTPPDHAPIPFITPPNSGDAAPSGISDSHPAPTLDTLLITFSPSSSDAKCLSPPNTPSPPPAIATDPGASAISTTTPPHRTSAFALASSSPMPASNQLLTISNQLHSSSTPASAATMPKSSTTHQEPNSKPRPSPCPSATIASSHLLPSLPEAAVPHIRRHEHSHSAGSLASMGSSISTGAGEGAQGAVVAAGAGSGQVVNRLKNMFGDVMARRNEAGSDGGSSRRSEPGDSSGGHSPSSSSLPQAGSGGSSRLSSALSKMSNVASVAKAEVGKKLMQSAMARLRDPNTDASPRNSASSSDPSAHSAR